MIMVAVTGVLFAIPLTLVMKTIELPVGPDGVPISAPSGLFVATLVVGATLLGYFLTAGLIKVVGGAFGGTGSFEQCKSAAAWSQFVVGLANLALLFISFVLPAAIDSILRLIFTLAAVYVSSAYIAEAHGFQSIGKVAAASFGVLFFLMLVLSSCIPATMVVAP